MMITNQNRKTEITFVALTGIGKFVFVDYFNLKFWFILVVCLAWYMYIMNRVKQNKGILEYWGFRKKGFNNSLRIVLPISIFLIAGFVVYGVVQNTLIFSWHLLPVLLLYPIWGIIQQFLIIGLIAGNLFDMHGNKLSDFWVVLITSTVFAVVHYPNIQLVVATFCLAIGYTLLYRIYRNLWVPGIFHGILGGFFYFFVLGDDQWEKVLGSLRAF